MKSLRLILAIISALAVFGIKAQAADVQANYKKHCSKCHGADGTGKTKMGKKLKIVDYTSPEVQAKFTDEEMFAAIKEGVKKEGSSKYTMKPLAEKLNEAEMNDLVALVRAFGK